MPIIMLLTSKGIYMNKKAKYEELRYEVISFDAEDVIVTSPCNTEGEISGD